MSIAIGKSHPIPTYLYNLYVVTTYIPYCRCPIAKYLGITLTDELSWSSHVGYTRSTAVQTPPWAFEEEPSALSMPKLK